MLFLFGFGVVLFGATLKIKSIQHKKQMENYHLLMFNLPNVTFTNYNHANFA